MAALNDVYIIINRSPPTAARRAVQYNGFDPIITSLDEPTTIVPFAAQEQQATPKDDFVAAEKREDVRRWEISGPLDDVRITLILYGAPKPIVWGGGKDGAVGEKITLKADTGEPVQRWRLQRVVPE
ncbi:hypothetical protein BS47DRAFT_1357447 [Hydnum rufescens UP504]|uniref:Uncharacterized protein n=1 Tax=Hydnum rufescens UP504 TaxID=1448309 RepID=A0A9P6E0I6_9AGAM|nr:hypothetical protein BS47DRAFT_1357447 [Hydnum rufescens UP504]